MSISTFESCQSLFAGDRIQQLAQSREGLLWLKVRSITRKEPMAKFYRSIKMPIKEKTLQEQFRAVYGVLLADTQGRILN